MKSSFNYHRPDSIESAIQMKSELGENTFYWAGGTDLMLQWKQEKITPKNCIDITTLDELAFITEDDTKIRIGALSTLESLEVNTIDDPYMNTISSVSKLMATTQTRTLATIGGNLCNASPAADLITTLVAMDSLVNIRGENGERQLNIEDMMISPGNIALNSDELITEIIIPKVHKPRASSYRRIDRTVVDIALVSAAITLTMNNNIIDSVRISLGAVAPKVIRSARAENMLLGTPFNEIDDNYLKDLGEAAAADASPISDIRASAKYRLAMVKVLVRRVVKDSLCSLSGENNDYS